VAAQQLHQTHTNFTVLSGVALRAGTLVFVRASVAAGTAVQTGWVGSTVVQICKRWEALKPWLKSNSNSSTCMLCSTILEPLQSTSAHKGRTGQGEVKDTC